jgi:DNA-binding SARP family transcriptional activator/Tol biopolymer transport system component
MAVIEFRTLGTLDLRRSDGTELHSLLAQPKRLALLAYLCIARPQGFHRRDTLLALFWPNADQTHARTSLRNALYVLRHSLGEAAFHTRGDEEVGVNFDLISCDAVSFDSQLASGRVEAALELYRGDLLSGFFLEDVPVFERWLEGERARLRGCAGAAATTASEKRELDRNLPEALQWARRAVELSNTDERAFRRLIELLARVGDRSGALQAYDLFAKHLAAEFEAEPSAETRDLVMRLRTQQPPESRVDASGENLAGSRKEFPAHPQRPASPGEKDRILGRWRTVATRPITAATLVALMLVLVAFSIPRALSGWRERVPERREKLTTTGNAMLASLSPDGQFLAYVTQKGDSQQVLIQDMGGGIPLAILAHPGAIWSLEWSPDGTRLLVGARVRAVVVPRLGGQAIAVGPTLVGQAIAHWVPNTSRMSVHSAADRRILVFDERTLDTLALPVDGNYTFLREGSWSPDGRVFAVVTETGDPHSWQIRAVRMNGTTEIIVSDTVLLGIPRWSSDGGTVYYPRGTDRIWRVGVSPQNGAAQGSPREVGRDLQMYPTRWGRPHFGLTRDGKGMVYARGARFSNLWLVELATGEAQLRTTALTTGTSLRWCPVVSPDGNYIAFAQLTDGAGELFTMPLSGGPAVKITTGARVRPEAQIAWSPDGTRIAFNTIRNGHSQVWVVTLADGAMRAFAESRMSVSTGALTWAPGSSIAYQTVDGAAVKLIDPASGEERTLVDSPQSGWVHSPAYSPDGNTLAVFHGPGTGNGEPGIYVFDVRTAASRRVETGLYPRGWSVDSRFIYFQWPQSPIVYRLDSRGGSKREIWITPPFREAQCRPVGATRPNAFICAAFDLVSDIWQIDNFDQSQDS